MIVLLGTLIPVGEALQHTGGTDLIAGALLQFRQRCAGVDDHRGAPGGVDVDVGFRA